MRSTFLLLSFLLCAGQFCKAQELTHVHFRISAQAFRINTIQFTLDDLDLYIDQEGDIMPVRPLNGINIDYYDKFSNKEKTGKIKSIGGINIDYYDQFDDKQKTGKIKSIGNISIDYFDSFAREEKQGKMKSFGAYNINYYDIFDGNEKKGRLSTIGPVTIEYYDRFSADSLVGSIKWIRGNTKQFRVTAGKRRL